MVLREKTSAPKMLSIRSARVLPPFRKRAGVVTVLVPRALQE